MKLTHGKGHIQKEKADNKVGQETTLKTNLTTADCEKLKNCTACGAPFTPKSKEHALCFCCWTWNRVGRNNHTSWLLIQKTKRT